MLAGGEFSITFFVLPIPAGMLKPTHFKENKKCPILKGKGNDANVIYIGGRPMLTKILTKKGD